MKKGEILSVTAITEVFPDGQKVIACAIEYDCDIDGRNLSKSMFNVMDRFDTPQYFNVAMCRGGGITDLPRTITRVYTNDAPSLTDKSAVGRFVILELSPEDESAATVYLTGFEWASRAHMKKVNLRIRQTEPIIAIDGTVITPPDETVFNNKIINKTVDDFIKLEYQGLKYNLFVPKSYYEEETKRYPLVQFIADSWGLGNEHEITLAQGNGGTIWAKPAAQEKRECFVVAPQFEGVRLCDDDWSVSPDLEKDKQLLDYLLREYRIDPDRVYTTGQSMGFLAGCELNLRYPGFFAASLMVSGFWNPDTMIGLKNQNIWFFVSEGDTRAYKNMILTIKNLKKAGAQISCYYWNGKLDTDQLNGLIRKAMTDGCNLKCTIFKKDSTVPQSITICNEATNHRGTWALVYELEAVQEWLFSNVKGEV